jgi:hypothetical protein
MERQNMMAYVTKTVMKVRFKISEIENELSRLQGKLGNDAFRRANMDTQHGYPDSE